MAIRANTLGKAAIVDQQLNKAYDYVEMVAINLPLIAELSKKLSLYTNADKVANHLEDMNIHITKEEKEALKSLVSGGYAAMDNLKAVADAIAVITESLELHSSDTTLHLSDAQNTLLERVGEVSEYLPNKPLHEVAYTGNYEDLENKPKELECDTALDSTSSAPLANRVITNELDTLKALVQTKVSDTSLHRVAFTGDFKDLTNQPTATDVVEKGNMFPVTSNAVYNVVANAIPEASGSISNTEIDMLFTDYSDVTDPDTTQPEEDNSANNT